MKPVPAKTCPSCGDRYDGDVLFCPKDGTPLANARTATLAATAEGDAYVGLELAGMIRVKHLIGIGSMGRVYRAFQGGIERDVAVKILHRELSGNAELVGRFHREAKIASRLVHANVVQVLMTGVAPQGTDARVGGELYLVMEHLDGLSLLSALAAAGDALPLPRALHIVLQICDAVGEAHAQGIVHRDLKPENVMLVRRGDDADYVKVLDFGIARLDWADRGMETQAGLIFGTAKYISPEGAEGQSVGPTADVYSIGTILYQCLAGRTPFEGDSPVALLVQHTHAPPPDLRSIARSSYVPEPLAAVVMSALAKRPSDRPPNARLLGRDLMTAVRASGLDPEEIAPRSPFLASSGSMKVASRERTKALEMTPALAVKLDGTTRAPSAIGPDASPSQSVRPAVATRTELTDAPMVSVPCDTEPVERTLDDGPSPAAPIKGAPSGSSGPLRLDDGPGEPPTSTMQGTESTASGAWASPRRRALRVGVIVASIALATALIALGAHREGRSGQAGREASLETRIELARDCMRRRAWDAPAHQNVLDIIGDLDAKWPSDARVDDLRREAADLLVSDALGRKYAGDPADALRLSRLALELRPELTTAQHLIAEIEPVRAPDIAPAPVASDDDRRGSRPSPRRPVASAGVSAQRPAQPAGTARPTASADPSGAVVPLLPPSPSPSPLPPKQALPPPPSTAPWL